MLLEGTRLQNIDRISILFITLVLWVALQSLKTNWQSYFCHRLHIISFLFFCIILMLQPIRKEQRNQKNILEALWLVMTLTRCDKKCALLEAYLHIPGFCALTIAKSNIGTKINRWCVQPCRTVEKMVIEEQVNSYLVSKTYTIIQ